MIIIQGVNGKTLPRLVEHALAERLATMPAVVVTGARQTGKSTLARDLTPEPRRYVSLDDPDSMDLAHRDPDALIDVPGAVTLDEIQREPNLLPAVKRAIDSGRVAGRFLLTGSANLLLMRGVSESLAGRASYLTLWPMTRREQAGLGSCGRWDDLFSVVEEKWVGLLAKGSEEADWRSLARRGGFPTPAIEMANDKQRNIWFEGYVRTYLERDLRELSSVSSLPYFRRLMKAAAFRIGSLVNQTELGRDIGMPQPTVYRYLNLLETSYLVIRLPAYSVNRTKRLIKAPKLYWGDTGVALYLADGAAPSGSHLENVVLNDLLAWRDARSPRAGIFYWRTTTGEEVDFVVENGGRLLPIEIKATTRPRLRDTVHIRSFRAEYGDIARAGLLLHAGTTTEWLTSDVLAVPWWKVV